MYGRLIYFNRTSGQYEVDWEAAHEMLGPAPEGADVFRGPFKMISSGRKLAQTWWGEEWIIWCEDQTEEYQQSRGRQIGRYGAALMIRFAPGEAAAIISDNDYFYSTQVVKITLRQFTLSQWRLVDQLVTSRTRYIAALIAGEFPSELMERLLEAELDVFDAPTFHTNEYARPEGTALAYIMAPLIDNDPLLLFQLRGRSRNDLLKAWIDEVPSQENTVKNMTPDDPAAYWVSQPLPDVNAPALNVRRSPFDLNLLPQKFVKGIPELCRKGSDYASDLWNIMGPLVNDEIRPVFPREQIAQQPLMPAAQERYDAIIELIDSYCQRELDEEFATLADRLTHVLATQPRSIILSGNPRTWACAIMYALAMTNDLFEPNPTGFQTTPDALCDNFGMSTNTTASRSRRIRKQLDIIHHDPRWTHSSYTNEQVERWLVRHRGMLVDGRQLPSGDETQTE